MTFALFDAETGTIPVSPTGTYTRGGRWSYPPHPYVDSGDDLTKVFYRVTGDDALGTFQGTLVRVNGVDRNQNRTHPGSRSGSGDWASRIQDASSSTPI